MNQNTKSTLSSPLLRETKQYKNKTTVQVESRYKIYDNSLESKIRWVEPHHQFISPINSSSENYNILNNCKTKGLPQVEIAKLPKFANKKESHSKFVDYQSSNSDKICLAHNV